MDNYSIEYGIITRCQWDQCARKEILITELRIGPKFSRRRFHVGCFFSRLMEHDTNPTKLDSIADLEGHSLIREADLDLVSQFILKYNEYKANGMKGGGSSNSDIDIPEGVTKNITLVRSITLELPNDNLREILQLVPPHARYVICSLVNKQFYYVSRQLLYRNRILVTSTTLWNTTEALMPFVMQFKKLAIRSLDFSLTPEAKIPRYVNVLARLTQLESLQLENEDQLLLPMLSALPQIIHFKYIGLGDEADEKCWASLSGLQRLSIQGVHCHINLSAICTGLKSLKFTSGSIDLEGLPANLEKLALLSSKFYVNVQHFEDLLPTLTRLTSLKTDLQLKSLSNCTALKTLQLKPYRNVVLSFPPRLENLVINELSAPWPALPTSLKKVHVINKDYSGIGKYESNWKSFLAQVSMLPACRASVTFQNFHGPLLKSCPEVARARDLTYVIAVNSHKETDYAEMVHFCSQPLPSALQITFYRWKSCRWKTKVQKLMESVASKSRLKVEYIHDDAPDRWE